MKIDLVISRITALLRDRFELDVSALTTDSKLRDLGIDSLDGMNIIFNLEEEFGVTIPEDEAKNYTTVAHAIKGITLLMEQKSARSQA